VTTLARRAVFATVALAATLTPVNVEAEASMGAVGCTSESDDGPSVGDRATGGSWFLWSAFIPRLMLHSRLRVSVRCPYCGAIKHYAGPTTSGNPDVRPHAPSVRAPS